jgi:hypothetical protein
VIVPYQFGGEPSTDASLRFAAGDHVADASQDASQPDEIEVEGQPNVEYFCKRKTDILAEILSLLSEQERSLSEITSMDDESEYGSRATRIDDLLREKG